MIDRENILIVLPFFSLLFIGVVMVTSSSVYVSEDLYGSPFYFAFRQVIVLITIAFPIATKRTKWPSIQIKICTYITTHIFPWTCSKNSKSSKKINKNVRKLKIEKIKKNNCFFAYHQWWDILLLQPVVHKWLLNYVRVDCWM